MNILLKSLSNISGLIDLLKNVISAWISVKEVGFQLKWILILNSTQKTEILTKLENLDLNTPMVERALSIIWDVNQDKLTFKPATKDDPNTKSDILSLLSTIFDPLGISTPSL